MKCPNCNETLLISQRNNVEIDYCPNCRGVWLDKGELDKILDYAERFTSGQIPETNYPPASSHDYPPSGKYNEYDYKKRKKKSFLGDFFDFD
jgi:Zn-finger nucleic acid-binding protein